MEIEDLLGVDGRTTSRLGLRGILYGTGRLARTIKATVMGTHRANRGAGTRKSASPKVQCPVPSAPQTYRVTLATSMVEVVCVGQMVCRWRFRGQPSPLKLMQVPRRRAYQDAGWLSHGETDPCQTPASTGPAGGSGGPT
jgi:hypothetical protein